MTVTCALEAPPIELRPYQRDALTAIEAAAHYIASAATFDLTPILAAMPEPPAPDTTH